jgi:hypothetical protein
VFPRRRLDIYLNDHLAGSTLGVELSRRAAAENRESEYGAFLERLYRDIAEDRRTLEAVMRALDVDRSPAKPAGAWLHEKVSRLKLNGQVRGYSPLSRLLELEGLETGVAGKRSLWQVLGRACPSCHHRREAFSKEARQTRWKEITQLRIGRKRAREKRECRKQSDRKERWFRGDRLGDGPYLESRAGRSTRQPCRRAGRAARLSFGLSGV